MIFKEEISQLERRRQSISHMSVQTANQHTAYNVRNMSYQAVNSAEIIGRSKTAKLDDNDNCYVDLDYGAS